MYCFFAYVVLLPKHCLFCQERAKICASCYTTNQRFAIINRPSSPCRNAKWTQSHPLFYFFLEINRFCVSNRGHWLISLELVRRHLSMGWKEEEKKGKIQISTFLLLIFLLGNDGSFGTVDGLSRKHKQKAEKIWRKDEIQQALCRGSLPANTWKKYTIYRNLKMISNGI